MLWSGGISFAGVIAFLFADLIVLPILNAYRKYYGSAFALRAAALMFTTMVAAALLVDVVFAGAGLIPSGARPSRSDLFGSITVNYTLGLNLAGFVLFAALFWITHRRGATDPVCGMRVNRATATRARVQGHTMYFCSEGCREAFGFGEVALRA